MEGSKTRAGRRFGDKQAGFFVEDTLKVTMQGERASEG
jgi:hypothetical protein